MTTYAGLIRVSHMGDRKAGDANVHTDRDQSDAIGNGLPKGATLELLPPELDVSGGLPIEQRPSLLAAIEGVEQGRYAGIIVAYLSRLGRNTREQLRAWDRVEAAGGRIVCVAENIDTTTPSGRFMRTVMLANAEREREEHVDRFDNLRRWATDAGVWQRRQTPRGYDKGPDRRLTPNNQKLEVRQAFIDRASGKSIVSIADTLKMTPQGVRFLLRNRVYLGELRVGKYVNPNAHPAIITREQFDAAQTTPSRPQRSPSFDGPALLAGILRCEGCDKAMTRRRTANVVYSCNIHHSGGRCQEPASVSCHLIDPIGDHYGAQFMAIAHVERSDLKLDDLRIAGEDADAETAAFIAHTSARSPGYSEGLRQREEAAATAWNKYRAALAQASAKQGDARWEDMDVTSKNTMLRGSGLVVYVRRAGGRGSRTPLADRCRVGRDGDPPPTFGVLSTKDNGERAGEAL